jgi:hypothetical protein
MTKLLYFTGLATAPPPYKGSLDPSRGSAALLSTAVGLIAGLVADTFIHGATALSRSEYLQATWYLTIGILLAASTFARHVTHDYLHPHIGYSISQATFDLIVILAAAVLIGIIDGPHFPSATSWLCTAAMVVGLLMRTINITVRYHYPRRLGTALLWAGTILCVVISDSATASVVALWLFPVAAALGALVEVLFETLDFLDRR